MDEWLDEQGLYRKNTALDGTCLFRATAEQLMPTNPLTGHLEMRKMCVKYISDHKEHFEPRLPIPFNEYIENIKGPKAWGGALELDAISQLFRVDFEVFHGPEPPLKVTNHGFETVLMLCVTGAGFYDAVYKKETIQTWGFCQSIVYSVLYGEVFKLDDLDYAVDKMLHDKAARAQRERYLSKQSITRDDCAYDTYLEVTDEPVDVKKVLDSGAILFPYKVAKALDPDIFRNIDFDNWVESQRGKPNAVGPCLCSIPVTRRSNFWYGNGGPLRVGVKCNVRVDDKILTGHIQEMSAGMGPAIVYVEELSQKVTVPYEHLIPVPRSSLKAEWSYAHKHQMITRLGNRSKEDANDMKRRMRERRGKEEDDTNKDRSKSEERISIYCSDSDSVGAGHPLSPSHMMIITSPDEHSMVDTSVVASTRNDYGDLPLNDLETLRFYFNMGVEYFRKGTFAYMKPLPLLRPVGQEEAWQPPVFEATEICHLPPPLPSPLSPVTPILPITVPPPSPGVLPPYPLTPSQVMSVPPPFITPVVPPPIAPVPVSEAANVQDTSPNQNKERHRGAKFNKPPRFQRLDSESRNYVNGPWNLRPGDDGAVQCSEISSSTPSPHSSPEQVCPFITPLPYPIVCQPMIPPYMFHCEGEMHPDGLNFIEMPCEVVTTPTLIESPYQYGEHGDIGYHPPYPVFPAMPVGLYYQ